MTLGSHHVDALRADDCSGGVLDAYGSYFDEWLAAERAGAYSGLTEHRMEQRDQRPGADAPDLAGKAVLLVEDSLDDGEK